MKVFITGINGFVGKHLSSFLLLKNFTVYGCDLSDKFEGNNKIIYEKADLLNPDNMKKLIRKIKPDYIFHLAGFSSVKKSFEQPELCKKINVVGTNNILKAIVDANINPRILVVSSADVYGIPKKLPIDEKAELNPISPYGESRREQENLCFTFYKKNNLQIIISRSFLHIGPGQQPFFSISDFAKQIAEIEKKDKSSIKVGNLEARRDFTDVRDMIKAYLLAIEKCNPGNTYNICSGKSYSIKEILDRLISLSKVMIRAEHDPNRMRPSDIPELLGDNSKFIKQTRWHPEIPIEKTLNDTLNYWRNNI